jgi:hypothetical protein
MRPAAIATLQQANRIGADPGARGQCFLRKLSAATKAPQQIRKCWRYADHDAFSFF